VNREADVIHSMSANHKRRFMIFRAIVTQFHVVKLTHLYPAAIIPSAFLRQKFMSVAMTRLAFSAKHQSNV